jgi:hypothetical protein
MILAGAPSMDRPAWEQVAGEFTFDGGRRDIVVLHADLHARQRVLDRLRQAPYELAYYRSGNRVDLPPAATDAFPLAGEADRMLSVKFADLLLNCHFFTPAEIEFDLDPREVRAQRQWDALLTPENLHETVIVRVRPDTSH